MKADHRLHGYLAHLTDAFERNPPPFGFDWYGDSFRAQAVKPFWLIQCLISNSVKEGLGARDLWSFSRCIADEEIACLVRRHAMDEAKHSRQYIAILSIVFPNALKHEDRRWIIDKAPRLPEVAAALLPAKNAIEILDTFIQINLGEFRTRLHQLLMQPVLERICRDHRLRKLRALMDSIAFDEIRHLYYTAKLINGWILGSMKDHAEALFDTRLKQFNELTMRELGEQKVAA